MQGSWWLRDLTSCIQQWLKSFDSDAGFLVQLVVEPYYICCCSLFSLWHSTWGWNREQMQWMTKTLQSVPIREMFVHPTLGIMGWTELNAEQSTHSLGRTSGKSSPFSPLCRAYRCARLATRMRTLHFRRFSPSCDVIWRQPDRVNVFIKKNGGGKNSQSASTQSSNGLVYCLIQVCFNSWPSDSFILLPFILSIQSVSRQNFT